jgi:hypothetical protein
MSLKRISSLLIALMLAFSVTAFAGDDHDKDKDHGPKQQCKKPPKGGGKDHDGDGGKGGKGVGVGVGIGTGGSVNNSGNNTNTNTNTATGGNATSTATATGGTATATQNQTQSQSLNNSGNSSAAASNNGNGSNDTSITTNVEAPKIPVSTAYAPNAYPTAPCFKGYGAGVQTMPVGISAGGGKVDENCAILETARSLALAGARPAYCQVMATDKYVKKAYGKNIQKFIDDCMYQEPQPPVAQPQPPVQIFVPSGTPAAAVKETPTPVVQAPPAPPVEPEHLVALCTFSKAITCTNKVGPAANVGVVTVGSVCRQMLEEAKRQIALNPNGVLIIRGNRNPSESEVTATARANNVRKALEDSGVPSKQLKVETGTGTARTVEVIIVPQA